MFNNRQDPRLEGLELQQKINDLINYYMPMDLDATYEPNKVTAIKKLNFIINNSNRQSLQESEFDDILKCSLTLVYYFGMKLKLSMLTTKYWHWCKKRLFHKAESAFQKTMDCFQPERTVPTIKITLTFFSSVDLWPFENFVGQILEVAFYFSQGNTILFHLMLTDIHCVLFSDIKSARHRMRVLYELLKSDNWIIDKHKLLPFVTRLLDFFAQSNTKDDKVTPYGYLRKGFEVCLRRIFQRVQNNQRMMIVTTMLNWLSLANMSDDDILEFSTLVDHVAALYEVHNYSESFQADLIEHILCNLVGSWREQLHENILIAIKHHCRNSINLKSIFSLICCIALEVPCNLSAAMVACIAMSIQDFALNGENLTVNSRYWMHAIVISVMSLICWVHKAPVLYRYVNEIIARRAKEAPQLNPPLLQTYNVGNHHVTWNKPNLFFEDWELRYALWKHFQNVRVRNYF
ncbi:unnamed protein product [Diatraea saccharalis]|uniref:Uncharacterized protein n=1 Tax=Diatraea saccharalis TaxID=40085 RepID=A0A9N9MZK4_9NEOP|nr:unnamed protein product [Diatraea saccharalis]